MICQVKIILNKKEKVLNAIVDTGNMLKEPITGNPVMVVERTELYDLMPKEILNNTEQTDWLGFNRLFDSNVRMTRMEET